MRSGNPAKYTILGNRPRGLNLANPQQVDEIEVHKKTRTVAGSFNIHT